MAKKKELTKDEQIAELQKKLDNQKKYAKQLRDKLNDLMSEPKGRPVHGRQL
jgi:predicted RNase H-like nuclease (RuvC/YqgF family)